MQLNRNGFVYVLDRTNGRLISAKPYEKVNWASHVDLETGRPVETELGKKLRAGEADRALALDARRPRTGRTPPFNPETGLLYANTMHEGRMYKHLETKPHVVGQRYMYMENLTSRAPHGQPIGHIEAIDPLTGEKKWRTPLHDYQIWSAMLSTGGGLLFTGKETGEFIAVDADTGKIVWEFQTGSGINAMPVTYTHRAGNTSRCCPASAGCTGTSRASSSRTKCRKAARCGPSR